jgi:hypothetical protein
MSGGSGGSVFPSLILGLLVAFSGCAVAPLPERSSGSQSEESLPKSRFGNDLTGVWEGASACRLGRYSSNCQGIRNIAFTFGVLEGSRAAGFYRCATGTVSCRNRLETGPIVRTDWKGKRLWLRVMLGDGSSCLYSDTTSSRAVTSAFRVLSSSNRAAGGQSGALIVTVMYRQSSRRLCRKHPWVKDDPAY